MLRLAATTCVLALSACSEGPAPTRVETSPDPSATIPASPSVLVRGRVVDDERLPLAGVRARLFAGAESWGPTSTPGVVFEATSDATGTFRIAAPLPTARGVVLEFEPGPLHAALRRSIEPDAAYPLDLGDVRVQRASVVTGRVVDARGGPIADASLLAIGGRETSSDVDGRFVLSMSRVAFPATSVHVSAPGHLSRTIPVEPGAPGSSRAMADVVLQASPLLRGVVLDASGSPVADAEVSAHPRRAGVGASARTDERGRFAIALREDAPHGLSASATGFLASTTFDARFDARASGADEARIVLRRARTVAVRVVDAATGASVPEFDLGARAPGDAGWRTHAASSTDADGVVVAHLEVGEGPALVTVGTPGDHPTRRWVVRYAGPLPTDADTPDRATILLLEPGRVRVHLPPGDWEQATATAHHRAESYPERPLATAAFPHDSRAELRPEILLRGLPPGEYDVRVRARGALDHEVQRVRVEPGATTEVGPLELVPTATIRGRIVLRDGSSCAGLVLTAGGAGRITLFDDECDFRVEELPPGRVVLRLLADPPRVPREVELAVDARPGAFESVVIAVPE